MVTDGETNEIERDEGESAGARARASAAGAGAQVQAADWEGEGEGDVQDQASVEWVPLHGSLARLDSCELPRLPRLPRCWPARQACSFKVGQERSRAIPGHGRRLLAGPRRRLGALAETREQEPPRPGV